MVVQLLGRAGFFNDEVDFVLRKKNSIVAIEVKSNMEKKTDGLDKFRQMFNPNTSFIIGNAGIKPEEFFEMDIRKLFGYATDATHGCAILK